MSESRFGMNQAPAGKHHTPTKTSIAAAKTSYAATKTSIAATKLSIAATKISAAAARIRHAALKTGSVVPSLAPARSRPLARACPLNFSLFTIYFYVFTHRFLLTFLFFSCKIYIIYVYSVR
jgi:hypothetical protein